mmetsp:Transcript_22254/g.55822  ORF Transcript_22254/g.55822 Transcript_22254/m.55822 type:complete len:247 (-) Transcript_22254:139-879(-)
MCRYGLKCQFAHGREELRPVMRHPKYKTEICKTFHTIGTCPYGKRCRFIHQTPGEVAGGPGSPAPGLHSSMKGPMETSKKANRLWKLQKDTKSRANSLPGNQTAPFRKAANSPPTGPAARAGAPRWNTLGQASQPGSDGEQQDEEARSRSASTTPPDGGAGAHLMSKSLPDGHPHFANQHAPHGPGAAAQAVHIPQGEAGERAGSSLAIFEQFKRSTPPDALPVAPRQGGRVVPSPPPGLGPYPNE